MRRVGTDLVTDTTLSSLVVILAVVAAAPLVVDLLGRRVGLPGVVVEIAGGILVGPALGWAHTDDVIDFLAQLGLATLMFLGGLEIDLPRIRGAPLTRSLGGWAISLALGVTLGVALSPIDGARSGLLAGLAVTTTAFGVLVPVLRDRRELSSPFGTQVLAGATVGEVGPIVAVAVFFGTDRPAHTLIVLLAFAGVVLVACQLALRERNARLARLIETTLSTSGQVAVRLIVLFLTTMVWLASELGLDILLGAFAAGMVTRLFALRSSSDELRLVESKLHGLGFGFLVPLFFVVSGMQFDLDAVTSDPEILLVVPVVLLAFLLVRGAPTALLQRDLPRNERAALACYLATQLPLVVVVTTIGVQTERLSSGTAAALVVAAMLSVLSYPLLAGWAVSGSRRRT